MRSSVLERLKETWPSTVVVRSEVKRFSGGILSGRTMANLDSQGAGPPGRFKLGRKTVYPVDELITWMQSRVEPGE